MKSIKKLIEKLLSGSSLTIQLKIFVILFVFLITQAGFQLWQNIRQANTAAYEMKETLDAKQLRFKEFLSIPHSLLEEKIKEEMRIIRSLTVGSISHMMVTGNAEIVGDWLEGLKMKPIFKSIQLYRGFNTAGEEAFCDNKTINMVNANLDDKTFSPRKPKPAIKFDADRMDVFQRAVESGEDQYYEEKINGEAVITNLLVIPNGEECHVCHGSNHKTRGIVRVSLSAEKAMEVAGEIQNRIDEEAEDKQERLLHLRRTSGLTRNLAIVAAVILIAVNLFVLNMFFRVTVVKPLNAIADTASRIAGGDLTTRIDTLRKDEIGALSTALFAMQENLKEMIHKINQSSSDVAGSAGELSEAARHIADGSGQQTNQMENTVASVDEMSSSILEVARNSSEALDSTNKAMEAAHGGEKMVEKTIAGIHEISAAMEKSSRVVEELGKNSSQINEIVAVINDIADQTNLLALNAAIEAARAGEAGRGFAVVADEVRKLAERTTTATKEIAAMVTKIQTDTKDTMNSMDMVRNEVDSSVGMADETGKSLENIVNQVNKSTEMVNQIATASKEQAKTVEDISKNMNDVVEVSRDTSNDTQKTSDSAEKLMELAGDLKKLVDQFKI
ncbi:MAG: hypothetical protein IEMM0002_0735 [bacterium]|nr:MAG: hypothetical protein IEMM0002_0735 [bacterium]